MPVYDYRCADCGREVEVTHGIHDAGPSACESCGGPMRKALSTPAIHFKGSGWAKKDARAAAKPAPADKDSKTSPPAGAPSSIPASPSGGEAGASPAASGGSDAGSAAASRDAS